MRGRSRDKYREALNAAYSMLGYSNGATIDVDTLDTPKEGYVVALETIGEFSKLQDVVVPTMVEKLREVSNKKVSRVYAGSFKDPETGNYLFEASTVLGNIDAAMILAKQLNQKYIFDLKSKLLIEVTNVK